jgi:shikimate dehydrogenase
VRAAVAGHPIAHSRSPQLHLAAYDALGLDWTYGRIDCAASELPALFGRLRAEAAGWAGVSLTMPLKVAAVSLLDRLETDLGAVNTVLVAPGGRLVGHNTDVDGIQAALVELLGAAPPRGVVLGSGGTARAAVAALAAGGAREVLVVARHPDRAGALVELGTRRGVEVAVVGWSAPPAGWPVVVTLPADPDPALEPSGPVLDVRYDPWPTRYAARAAAAGLPVLGGLAVLLAQAARQVELMTGRPAPLAAMRASLAPAPNQPSRR